MNFDWEDLAPGVRRCRLPFCDVTVGAVSGATGTLLVDAGTTLAEAAALAADLDALGVAPVGHVVLTHNDFDHVLGAAGFPAATVYCAPEVAATLLHGGPRLRQEALHYDADADELDRTLAARRVPARTVRQTVIGLGGVTIAVTHPGRGHTDHDLVAVVRGSGRTVVFCGDLVEESGAPSVEADSDPAAWPATLARVLQLGGPDAVYVPGHGATVDADFVQRQAQWLSERSVTDGGPAAGSGMLGL
ncbi:MBL fold metallo-hydrolase [uncultured Mycolicibacterium sp.]|uniref:MBL fold metallo-hydrolase n=1 Tax=uncultured Mycolicibacterium sp. TaxID=2320817 RepID=UPI0026301C87|nr:MBL fold metallo-hydrolase [uncultured Mycolicibacterium sp.]